MLSPESQPSSPRNATGIECDLSRAQLADLTQRVCFLRIEEVCTCVNNMARLTNELNENMLKTYGHIEGFKEKFMAFYEAPQPHMEPEDFANQPIDEDLLQRLKDYENAARKAYTCALIKQNLYKDGYIIVPGES